ncbi:hypothetical protein [Variovorax sp. LG9.2]|uniref:hypothetical protein n=1 Tax=Variovorax sp. LG9.2 TaxID=3048626 RepID=UPI002B23DC4D|nr:hypothetical protein [Variovorax sp. LG9.2]MEB0059253.1 hypothetical protein [Variovorax sp. LG9.2]
MKRPSVEKASTAEAAMNDLRLADSYSRLGTVMSLRPHLNGLDWWRVLGDEWSGCDNVAAFRLDLGKLFRTAGRNELDVMMTNDERKALEAMPATITVYRGCYAANRLGLSWTTERSIAEGIVSQNRYRQPGQALLIVGRVPRSTCVLKLNREESEIISPAVRRIEEIMLTRTEKSPRLRAEGGNGYHLI